MTTALIARRVAAGVPLWDIYADNRWIGSASDLPNERCPMATVRYSDEAVTFAGRTVRESLAKVRLHVDQVDEDIELEAAHEYYCEVIAPMEAAERAAERGWLANGYDDLP